MNATLARTLALTCVFSAACSSSSSNETSDAATPDDAKHDSATHDAGTRDSGIADASTGDGYDGPPPPVFTLDAGTTWTDLYRDYFGNDSQLNTPGCARGDCHGTTTQTGYISSNGYLCPAGDKEACYKSITSQADGGPGLITADASFNADFLSQVLCADNDAGVYTGGYMPYNAEGSCKYYFTPTDMERLRRWVEAGYPDN